MSKFSLAKLVKHNVDLTTFFKSSKVCRFALVLFGTHGRGIKVGFVCSLVPLSIILFMKRNSTFTHKSKMMEHLSFAQKGR